MDAGRYRGRGDQATKVWLDAGTAWQLASGPTLALPHAPADGPTPFGESGHYGMRRSAKMGAVGLYALGKRRPVAIHFRLQAS